MGRSPLRTPPLFVSTGRKRSISEGFPTAAAARPSSLCFLPAPGPLSCLSVFPFSPRCSLFPVFQFSFFVAQHPLFAAALPSLFLCSRPPCDSLFPHLFRFSLFAASCPFRPFFPAHPASLFCPVSCPPRRSPFHHSRPSRLCFPPARPLFPVLLPCFLFSRLCFPSARPLFPVLLPLFPVLPPLFPVRPALVFHPLRPIPLPPLFRPLFAPFSPRFVPFVPFSGPLRPHFLPRPAEDSARG